MFLLATSIVCVFIGVMEISLFFLPGFQMCDVIICVIFEGMAITYLIKSDSSGTLC